MENINYYLHPQDSLTDSAHTLPPNSINFIGNEMLRKEVKKYIFTKDHLLDPPQFAYQSSSGVDDAILTLLHLVYTHLEAPKTHIKIIFFYFSSAFKTIHPWLRGCMTTLYWMEA